MEDKIKNQLAQILSESEHLKDSLPQTADGIIRGNTAISIINKIDRFNAIIKSDFPDLSQIGTVYTWGGDNSKGYVYTVDVIRSLSEIIATSKVIFNPDAFLNNSKKEFKIFISHGKKEKPLSIIKDFLIALGIYPLIAKIEPSSGKSLNPKVEENLKKSDAIIILATAERKVGEFWNTGENIINEEGWAKSCIKQDNFIYLKDKEVVFPSNIREKVYEEFTDDNMTDALIHVARELHKMKLI